AITYAPNANYNGTDTLTYEICDTDGECDTAVLTLTVIPVDDPPVANNDTASVSEDGSVAIVVAVNDTDLDGDLDTTSVSVLDPPSNGRVTVDQGSGAVTYEPDWDFNGQDTFTYQICDSVGACDTATVVVNVTPIDDPLAANDDSASVAEDSVVVITVLANDEDPDGVVDSTTVAVESPPTNGTAVVDPITGTITYEPHANFNGSDSFTYRVCNTEGECDTARVVVIVTSENDAPLAICQETVVVDAVATPIHLLGVDPDGDPVTYGLVVAPERGTISQVDANGTVYYSSRACTEISVDIHVGEGGPTGSLAVPPGATVRIQAGVGDPSTVTIVRPPAHGTANVDPLNGTISYTPSAGFEGSDEFSYWICSEEDDGFSGPVTIVFEVCDEDGACDQCVVQFLVVRTAGGGGEEACDVRVIISEVAWSGTHADPDHEWIELRNLEDAPVDLEGWTLRWYRVNPETGERGLWKAIPLSGLLSPFEPDPSVSFAPSDGQSGAWWMLQDGEPVSDCCRIELPEYLLVERETDDSVFSREADLIYEDTMPLGRIADFDDRGEVIELIDPTGCIVDTANREETVRDGWAAGALVPAATMERTDPFEPDTDENWHTNLGLLRNDWDVAMGFLHGTPKRPNSPLLSRDAEGLRVEPTSHPVGEPFVIPFEARPEWPVDSTAWHVVVTMPGSEVAIPVEWMIEELTTGEPQVIVQTSILPLNVTLYLWVRTPTGDVLFAPYLLYPY
ncbi:MAG: lamin tail domain-containing protein, partial [Candidatus Atribacteria bacterium]